jgi:hypothetical protein
LTPAAIDTSMTNMLADVMIELDRILHPERVKRLEA